MQVAQAARLHAARALFLSRRVGLAHEIVQTWQGRVDWLLQARASSAVTALEVASAQRSLADARVAELELEQQLAVEIAGLDQAIGWERRESP
jgi:outer membrane protein TolC